MNRIVTEFFLKKFLRATSGATAIEYALIAGGISIAIIGGVALLGTEVTGLFTTVSTSL